MNNSATATTRGQEAFADDWSASAANVRTIAARYFRSSDDIDDAVQAVASAAWSAYAALQQRDAFPVWVERIATDTVLPRLAKKKRNIKRREVIPDAPLEDFGSVKRYGFHKREFHLDYQAALATLPEHIRSVWVRYQAGESLVQIARTLDLNYDHVQQMCATAQARLRLALTGYERSA